mgnify:FL=1
MIVKSVETALYAFVRTDPNDVSHLVDYDLLAPFVPGKSTPSSQGVDDAVKFITTKMENVLHILGETFEYV